MFPLSLRGVSSTEIRYTIERLGKTAPRYRDWWRELLPSAGLNIRFDDREPKVDIAAIEDWERTLDWLDGDALVTRALVDARLGEDSDTCVHALTRWPTIIKVCDRELEQMFRSGLSDLHIHAGGARFAQAAWHDFVDGYTEIETMVGIRGDHQLVGLLERAKDVRLKLLAKVGLSDEDSFDLGDDGFWRWDRKRLLGERLLLARCWKADPDDHDLDRALDTYLTAKCAFISSARQKLNTPPGLDYFKRENFERLKMAPLSPPPSNRILMGSVGDALMVLGESSDLRRIELRRAPTSKPVDLARFLDSFGELVERFEEFRKANGAAEPIDVRWALHLKRSRGKGSTASDLATLLTNMDRETAAIRLALDDQSQGDVVRRWLARIDIAGQERDTGLIDCVPYIRLAVGDEDALKDIDETKIKPSDPRAPEFAEWLHMRERGSGRPSLAEQRLGITVHAGEDFADPLSGLHEIAAAIEFLPMQPGDSIGHGLALKFDIGRFRSERASHALIRRSAHMDTMAWLYGLIDRYPTGPGAAIRHQIRAAAETCARDVWGFEVGIEELVWLRQARAKPCTPIEIESDRGKKRLWRNIVTAREKGDKMIPLPSVHFEHPEFVEWVQSCVIQDIRDRRIVVEVNPSSNLRISAAGEIDNWASTDLLLESRHGLLVSINTDNPGVCASRIENEYALMVMACRHREIPEWQIREMLDSARAVGLERTYWPRQALPTG